MPNERCSLSVAVIQTQVNLFLLLGKQSRYTERKKGGGRRLIAKSAKRGIQVKAANAPRARHRLEGEPEFWSASQRPISSQTEMYMVEISISISGSVPRTL